MLTTIKTDITEIILIMFLNNINCCECTASDRYLSFVHYFTANPLEKVRPLFNLTTWLKNLSIKCKNNNIVRSISIWTVTQNVILPPYTTTMDLK